MSHKTLIIYQNKILFNILNELYLKQFSIILTDKKSYRNLSLKDKDNYLVITNENDLDFEHKLVFNNFPLKIKKILDSINISFLKNSYKLQSEIKIGSYVLNINSKEICSTNKKLFLTEREANLILFLNKSNTPVNINELQ